MMRMKKRKWKYRIITSELVESNGSVCAYFYHKKHAGKQVDVNWPVARTAACLGVLEKTATVGTKKLKNGEHFDDEEKRDREMEVPDELIPVTYKVQLIAVKFKLKVLFLPMVHPELNPSE